MAVKLSNISSLQTMMSASKVTLPFIKQSMSTTDHQSNALRQDDNSGMAQQDCSSIDEHANDENQTRMMSQLSGFHHLNDDETDSSSSCNDEVLLPRSHLNRTTQQSFNGKGKTNRLKQQQQPKEQKRNSSKQSMTANEGQHLRIKDTGHSNATQVKRQPTDAITNGSKEIESNDSITNGSKEIQSNASTKEMSLTQNDMNVLGKAMSGLMMAMDVDAIETAVNKYASVRKVVAYERASFSLLSTMDNQHGNNSNDD